MTIKEAILKSLEDLRALSSSILLLSGLLFSEGRASRLRQKQFFFSFKT
jgi:hypothetical protein